MYTRYETHIYASEWTVFLGIKSDMNNDMEKPKIKHDLMVTTRNVKTMRMVREMHEITGEMMGCKIEKQEEGAILNQMDG